ncbi:MAG: RNA polymerase sigma factor [Solirubrobacteraceae bacterium]
MSSIDALPADQKAVLQLLLRQGRSYHELSGLLKLDADAVRRRAHAALDALGPDDGASLSDERRHELSDWLLGQQSEGQAEATKAFLAGSAPGRAWARTVGDQLRPLGGERVPEIPAAGPAAPAAPAAAPAEAPAAAAAAEAAAPVAMAPAGPRVSRRGGAFLIGGAVAVAAIIVALVLILSGGDSGDKGTAAASTPTTFTSSSTTAAQPTVKAQINLTPPGGGSKSKRAGILWILDAGGQAAFTAAAQGLPTTKGSAYGIWLYNSATSAKLIGGFDQYDKQGRILASGALQDDPTKYKEIIVTRETGGRPTTPGPILLQGAVASATKPSTGTGTTTTP